MTVTFLSAWEQPLFSGTHSPTQCVTACPPHWLPLSSLEPKVRTTFHKPSADHFSQAPDTSRNKLLLAPSKASASTLLSRNQLRSDRSAQPRATQGSSCRRDSTGPWEGDRCPGEQERTFPLPFSDPLPDRASSVSTIPESMSQNNPTRCP